MIDISRFSIEKDFTIVAAPELLEKISEHDKEMQTVTEWKNTDADLIAQYNKNFADFKNILKHFITWHVKVIQENEGRLWNHQFEMQMGIDVDNRALNNSP